MLEVGCEEDCRQTVIGKMERNPPASHSYTSGNLEKAQRDHIRSQSWLIRAMEFQVMYTVSRHIGHRR
jgi:hypothetical protein